MKIIIKLSAMIVLSSLTFGAFAHGISDTPDSPFACQAQADKMANSLPTPFECINGEGEHMIDLSADQQLHDTFCTLGEEVVAPISVCEAHPENWTEIAPGRHMCDPDATPEQCAVEVY